MPRAQERSKAVRAENYTIPSRPEHNHNTEWSNEFGEYRSVNVNNSEIKVIEIDEHQERKLIDILQNDIAIRLHKLIDVTNMQLQKPNVTTAILKLVLTNAQFVLFKESLIEKQDGVEVLYGDGCPEDLRRYSQKVARADFLYGKAERMSAKREYNGYKYRFNVIEKAYSDAESAYESAVENLEELWSVKTPQEIFEIENWLDRQVTWTVEKHPSLEPEGVPRVRNSRSPYTLAYLPKLSKKLKREHCILDALIAAIDEIIYVYENEVIDAEVLKAQSIKLKKLLLKLTK